MFQKFLRHFSLRQTSKGVLFSFAVLFASLTGWTANAQTFLTEKELLATIPGASIYSKSAQGKPWAQNYSKADSQRNGAIRGVFGKRKYYASWFVRDGKWCENWGNGQACWNVERVDSNSFRLYNDGKPRAHLWHLRPIDPPRS